MSVSFQLRGETAKSNLTARSEISTTVILMKHSYFFTKVFYSDLLISSGIPLRYFLLYWTSIILFLICSNCESLSRCCLKQEMNNITTCLETRIDVFSKTFHHDPFFTIAYLTSQHVPFKEMKTKWIVTIKEASGPLPYGHTHTLNLYILQSTLRLRIYLCCVRYSRLVKI